MTYDQAEKLIELLKQVLQSLERLDSRVADVVAARKSFSVRKER